MQLNRDEAERAMRDGVASPMGISVTEAAWGIVKIIETKMADSVRVLAANQGVSLRDFVIVAEGGAGPVHMAAVAEDLGIDQVIVPPGAGVFSATGLLCSDVVHDYARSSVSILEETPADQLTESFRKLEAQATEDLAREGLGGEKVHLLREADVRYAGQGFELRVPVRSGRLNDASKKEIRRRFERLHKQLYGHTAPGEPAEVVSYRLRAVVPVPKYQPRREPLTQRAQLEARPLARRPLYLGPNVGSQQADFYSRDSLQPGIRIDGPAVVLQKDSTTLIPAGWLAIVDEYANLVLSKR